jgi:hypothetical protein
MDMEKLGIILGATLLLLVSVQVSAAIIDMGDYQYDEVTGIQWLDLTFTDGMTMIEAVDTFGGEGWSIANKSQYNNMFVQYDDPTDSSLYGLTSGFSGADTAQSVRGTSLFENARGSGIVNYKADLNQFAADFGVTRDTFHYSVYDRRVDQWTMGYYLNDVEIYVGGTLEINYIDNHLDDTLIAFYDNPQSSPLQR